MSFHAGDGMPLGELMYSVAYDTERPQRVVGMHALLASFQ